MIRFFRRVSRKFSRRLIRIVDLASPSSRSKCSYEKRIRFLRALFSPSLPRASLIRRELTSDISCYNTSYTRDIVTVNNALISNYIELAAFFIRSTRLHASSSRIEYIISVRTKRKNEKRASFYYLFEEILHRNPFPFY